MGCFASKHKKEVTVEEEASYTSEASPRKGGGAGSPRAEGTAPAESTRLIDEIIERVSGIRSKAEEYRSQLQTQVIQIEEEKLATSSGTEKVNANGVVLSTFAPADNASGSTLLEATEGQQVEIIVRDAGGWAYCRAEGRPQPGWLPSSKVAEVARVIADHDPGDSPGLLSANKDDLVEVVNRHYSGWAFCREWKGPPLPGAVPPREGWVTDAYLEDKRSEAMLASKWHRLVLQALDQVVSSAKELEGVLAKAKVEDWGGDLSAEWMGQCLEFARWLTTELQAITQAVSQHEQSACASGGYAIVQWDVASAGHSELAVSAGDRVQVLDSENPDWAWCRLKDAQGWVPRNVLQAEGEERQKLALEDLPTWVKVGVACKWWSTSGRRFCDVIVDKVDPESREVRVVFAVDKTSWKCVSFDHFGQPQEDWLLQPHDDKVQELRSQLPTWVEVGRPASWWSKGQSRCHPVTIREVCTRKRAVFVSFDADKKVRKVIPWHELIDDVSTCLLQKREQDHAWRQVQKRDSRRKSASGLPGLPIGDSIDTIDQLLPRGDDEVPWNLSDAPAKRASLSATDRQRSLKQTAAQQLNGLLDGIQQDLGEMIEDEQVESSAGPLGSLKSALSFMGLAKEEPPWAAREANDWHLGMTPEPSEPLEALEEALERDLIDSELRNAKNFWFGGQLPKERTDSGTELGPQPDAERLDSRQEALNTLQELQRELQTELGSTLPAFDRRSGNGEQQADTPPKGHSGPLQAQVSQQLPPPGHPDAPARLPDSAGGLGGLRATASATEGDAPGRPAASPAPATAQPADAEGLRVAASGTSYLKGIPEGSSVHSTAIGFYPAAAVGGQEGYTESEQGMMERIGSEPPAEDGPLFNTLDRNLIEELGGPAFLTKPPEKRRDPPELARVDTGALQRLDLQGLDRVGTQDMEALLVGALSQQEPADAATSAVGVGPAAVPTALPHARAADPPAPAPTHVVPDGAAAAQPHTPPQQQQPQQSQPQQPQPPGGGPQPIGGPPRAQSKAAAPQQQEAPHTEAWGAARPETSGGAQAASAAWGTSKLSPPPGARPDGDRPPLAVAGAWGAAPSQPPASTDSHKAPDTSEDLEAEIKETAAAYGAEPAAASASSLLMQAMRVVLPDTWDSEGEGRRRAPPDTKHLSEHWPELQQELDTASSSRTAKVQQELQDQLRSTEDRIDQKVREVGQKLESRAKAAEAKLDPASAQKYRSMEWTVMNAGEKAKEKASASQQARIELRRHKARSQKEALRQALADPAGALRAAFLPDAASLQELSLPAALEEAADAARDLFRAAEVAAVRPAAVAHGAGPRDFLSEASRARAVQEVDLEPACQAALRSLCETVDVLLERVQQEKNEMPTPDPKLEDLQWDGLSREEKRDKKMFDGQQEFDWDRAVRSAVAELERKREAVAKEKLDRVERVLRRRWRRGRERDRTRTLAGLAAFTDSIAEAEDRIRAVYHESAERADEEVRKVVAERRHAQEQTQTLLSAALVIREEKDRMNDAWYAAPRERQVVMLKALRRVRRLNEDMKNLLVMAELKQKHSVLLYSLRMLEAKLKNECQSTPNDIEDGPLELGPAQREQLEEAARVFEEQLQADIDAIRTAHGARAERAVARVAAEFRRSSEAQYEHSVQAAREAITVSSRAAARADLAAAVLRPLADAVARLTAEAAWHIEVSKSPLDVPGFLPKRRRFEEVLENSLKSLAELRKRLRWPDQLPHHPDREWEAAVAAVEKRWREFCERHPDAKAGADGDETPRSEAEDVEEGSPSRRGGPVDMDLDDYGDDAEGTDTPRGSPSPFSPGSPARRVVKKDPQGRRLQAHDAMGRGHQQGSQAGAAARGGKVAARGGRGGRVGFEDAEPVVGGGAWGAGPARPSTGAPGRPTTAAPSRPAAPPPGGMPQSSMAFGPAASQSSDAKDEKAGHKGAALLAQLDELSKTMDNALGKSSGTFARTSGVGQAAGAAPPPPRSRPAAPGPPGRSRR